MENPRLIHERHIYPCNVTGAKFGLAASLRLFFESHNGRVVLNQQGPQHMWFQQDGATSRTTCPTMQILRDAFPNRKMTKFDDIDWSLRLPDLTASDFHLCRYLKERICGNKKTNNIRQEINQITQKVCQDVMKKATERVRIYTAYRGDIMFHN